MPSVLVVDDDGPVRMLLLAILRREGYEVAVASDGQEAFGHLATRQFNAIILDLIMPVMSGHDVLELLANVRPLRKNVIVLTAASERHRSRMNETAVKLVMPKPFDLRELTACLREMVSPHQLLAEDNAADRSYSEDSRHRPLLTVASDWQRSS